MSDTGSIAKLHDCVSSSGRGFVEVPFFATREGRRGKGYGRCLLEAIEDIARACGAVRILLCSTDDPDTRSTWKRLGFRESTMEDFRAWDVGPSDLLHMTNTVQMHKVSLVLECQY